MAAMLRPTWKSRIPADGSVPASEETLRILAFAFDEVGTSKAQEESWAVLRHGLYRLLLLVEKYGGALIVRSGGVEIGFIWAGRPFGRYPHHLGFLPTWSTPVDTDLGGTQLQLILPLVPQLAAASAVPQKPNLDASLPKDYVAEDRHPRGHLVPLREYLDGGEVAVGTTELAKFRRLSEALARQLILDRPPSITPLSQEESFL